MLIKKLKIPLNKVAIELNKKILNKKKINEIKLNNLIKVHNLFNCWHRCCGTLSCN